MKLLNDLPPPSVTAKSWSIVDGKSGDVLFGKGENEKREMASITKVMTSFVTLQICQRIKLDMRRTMFKVSKSSASMGGTSAKLRTGDILSVWDLLHGLLLPSGNDAAICLAENFGEYLYEISLSKSNSVQPPSSEGKDGSKSSTTASEGDKKPSQ